MASANILLGAVVLIAAGIYQWTPIKNACLAQYQTLRLYQRLGHHIPHTKPLFPDYPRTP